LPSVQPLIVEFVGLPGAGKSTLCASLCAAGGVSGIALTPCISASFGRSATSHLPLLPRKVIAVGRILQSFLRHPRSAWLFLRFGLASHPRTLWKIEQSFSGISMLPRLDLERATARAGREALVFEQGVVQLFGSIALPAVGERLPDPRALARALLPGRISGLIWTGCDQAVALARLRSRSHSRSRFNDWSDAEAETQMRAMLAVLEAAVGAAEDAGVPVLRVDALQPVEANTPLIAEWIAGLAADHLTPG